MSDVFLGQILMFGGNFAPRNFAFCNGQLLPIANNQALFALLGTTYGGDGVTTFALPDLRSRLPVQVGQGTGLSNYAQGQSGGSQTATILVANTPAHNHTLQATQTIATTNTIGTSVLPGQPTVGNPPAFYGDQQQGQPPLVPQQLAAGSCSLVGGSQPHSNLMPSLCVTFIIALQGIFPSRN
jgi:microcystin-dependent protein